MKLLRSFTCWPVLLLLASCAGSLPPVQLYHLRSAAPAAAPAPLATPYVWQLMAPVRVPDYLDREAILVPQGQTGLLVLSGHRWAETLRDSVPRVLQSDLAAWLGGDRLWAAPLPPGVTVTRQLRVELQAFEAMRERSAVLLRAQWSVSDPTGRSAARSVSADIVQNAMGPDVDQLVAAHRMALWRLAERIAATP